MWDGIKDAFAFTPPCPHGGLLGKTEPLSKGARAPAAKDCEAFMPKRGRRKSKLRFDARMLTGSPDALSRRKRGMVNSALCGLTSRTEAFTQITKHYHCAIA